MKNSQTNKMPHKKRTEYLGKKGMFFHDRYDQMILEHRGKEEKFIQVECQICYGNVVISAE